MPKPKTEVATTNNAPKTLKDMLLAPKMQQRIKDVLPSTMDPLRMALLASSEVAKTPKLAECGSNSIITCLIEASQVGLEINGALGHAYLVPYRNGKTKKYESQLILGYRGLLELARRSGQIQSVQVELIREGDGFKHVGGTTPSIEHTPLFGNRSEVIGVYAVATFKDGGFQFAVMSKADVDDIRKGTNGKFGPWVDYWDEMAKKTVLRRLCKLLPMQSILTETVNKDEYRDAGVMQGEDFIDIQASEVDQPSTLDDMEKDLVDDSQDDGDDTTCAGCSTPIDVGPNGLCLKCQDAADASAG